MKTPALSQKLTQKISRAKIRKAVFENYPLLCILVGSALIAFMAGPYRNGDTEWEYKAASGVMQWGMPYVEVRGSLMNQPPLGFYLQAGFMQTFGLALGLDAVLVTLLGLGCTVLVYKIGKDIYGKSTGTIAAALFALSPWHLVLSRSFLIDVPCLLFSLLSLYVALVAARRQSNKLWLIAGLAFAAAFLTKLFAVFILLPIVGVYFYYRPQSAKRMILQLAAFILPVVLISLLWYQGIVGRDSAVIFWHSDFRDLNPPGEVASPYFLGNFLLNYGMNIFFLAATALALVFSFFSTAEKQSFDFIFLVTMALILAINFIAAIGFNLAVPYNSAIKYCYQALPFFSILAGSLVTKCSSTTQKLRKKGSLLSLFVKPTVVLLLAASVFTAFSNSLKLSSEGFLLFRVRMDGLQGYTLFNSSPINPLGLQMDLQVAGFLVMFSGVLWVNRGFVVNSLMPMHQWVAKMQMQQKTHHLQKRL